MVLPIRELQAVYAEWPRAAYRHRARPWNARGPATDHGRTGQQYPPAAAIGVIWTDRVVWHPVMGTFRDGHAETLARRRRDAGLVGTRRRPAPGSTHRRPGHPATQGHLVPGHQPGTPRRPAPGPKPAPGRGPGRDHPDLRHPQLDRAKLQAGQRRAGMADFQVRSGTAIRRHQALVNCAVSFCCAAWFAHPPPPAAAPLAPPPGSGERGLQSALPARHRRPGPGRSAPCAPGSPPGSRRSAGGPHRRKRPRRRSCKPLINSVAAGCGLHLYIPN